MYIWIIFVWLDYWYCIFNTVFKKFFYEDTDNIKASLSELLRIYDAPDSEIAKICNFDHYEKISQYIVDKAQLNGQLDKYNKKPILTLSLLEERYKQYNNRISSSNSTTYVKSPRHFSFSHLRCILEGSQPNQPCWAEELCKSCGLPDIQISSALNKIYKFLSESSSKHLTKISSDIV